MRTRRRFRSAPRRDSQAQRWLWLPVVLACVAAAALWYTSRPRRQSPPRDTAIPITRSQATTPRRRDAVRPSDLLPEGAIVSEAQPYPRPPRSLLEIQIALDRQGISSGSLDGRLGTQTRLAIAAFQRKLKLRPSGEPDPEIQQRLQLDLPPLTVYRVTSNDLAQLQPLGKTWTAKSQQSALYYENLLELAAERSHAHPACILRLNLDVDWTNVAVGAVLQIPSIPSAAVSTKAAFVTIRISEKTLEAFDEETNLLLHFPCSIAQRVEKRPVGVLHVQAVAPQPNYTFDPELFPESPEAQQIKTKLVLPPGPNNPVGSVWIGLDRTGYGIHGTPNPEQVGRTESHGCFRLANWNAERLLGFCWVGMPVYVEP